MIEIKPSKTAWDNVFSRIRPKVLSEKDKALNDKRTQDLEKLKSGLKNEKIWIKINNGIFRGSIFPVFTSQLYYVFYKANPKSEYNPQDIAKYEKRDTSVVWDFHDESFSLHTSLSSKVEFACGNAIFTEFFGTEVTNNISFLLDYDSTSVFCLNENLRPKTFSDRLNQDVGVGDLVVVALHQGQGLDICVVKGFADAKRVVIESVEHNIVDRIIVESDNTCNKIMKMPMSLKDTALMLKLSRN